MKKAQFTEAQIVYILKQVAGGESVESVCRKARISERTFYRWKQKYGKIKSSKKYKQMDEALAWRKSLVAGVGKVLPFKKHPS